MSMELAPRPAQPTKVAKLVITGIERDNGGIRGITMYRDPKSGKFMSRAAVRAMAEPTPIFDRLVIEHSFAL